MSLWISYAWKDNEEGNFDYLVQELTKYGVETKFDKVSLIPGQKLWTQIAEKINSDSIKAWAYLITPNSLKSIPCLEELEYAINRAINQDSNFPLIGLLAHGVPFDSVPLALKVRLCVSLADPNWKEQIKAGLEKRPVNTPNNNLDRFIINTTWETNTFGTTSWIEVRPRFEEVYNWRIGVLNSHNIINWGTGPVGSKNIFPSMEMSFEGEASTSDNMNFKLVGSKKISPTESAFIHLAGMPSKFVLIGNCDSVGGPILNSFIIEITV